MTTNETAKALARIRWQAEAGLSGFETLTPEGASASARLSLQSILDALERLDNADRPAVSGVGRIETPIRDEAQVVSLDIVERRQREAAGFPLGLSPENGDRLKDHAVTGKVHDGVRLQENRRLIDSGDNVEPIFDRLADRVARDRLRRATTLGGERET